MICSLTPAPTDPSIRPFAALRMLREALPLDGKIVQNESLGVRTLPNLGCQSPGRRKSAFYLVKEGCLKAAQEELQRCGIIAASVV